MRYAVLGPLEVREGDAIVDVAGGKERLLLAVLASVCPAVVSVDSLLEQLWEGNPPPTARKSLQSHVVRLRSALEPHRPKGSPGRYVVRREAGYALAVDRRDLDTLAFADLVAQGRALLASGDVEQAHAVLAEALSLWRGRPYGDWPEASFAEAERRRLEGLWSTATGSLLEAELARGHHVDVIPRLEQMVGEDPLREDWWSMLSVALYRSGRQGEALDAVRRARRTLADELGVDPGPRLRSVEQALLEQDPVLDLPRQRDASESDRGSVAGPALVEGCPYKGLATYRSADAALFRGRSRLVSALVAALVDSPLLVMSGSSGVGKSSVVRAGVLPALAAGALPGSRAWPHVVVTPGPHAVDQLATLTGEETDPTPVVLVCDQVERLWSTGTVAAERVAFLDTLVGLVQDGVAAVCLVVVRADHIGLLAEHPAMAERMAGSLVLVPALTELELHEVVEGPAAAAGLQVEPELVELVTQEVLGRSGGLPLLSTALVGTWERRRGTLLHLAGYLASGGVSGAVARSADTAYASLDPAARDVARQVLVRLVDQDVHGLLRCRRVPVAELDLAGQGGETRRAVVEALVARRLLSMDADHVEVAHESLLEAWPRLTSWLADDAAGRAVRRQLAPAAQEWLQRGRPEDELFRGARLDGAREWADTHRADVTGVEREFLDASLRKVDADLAEARSRADREAAAHRRTRRLAAGLTAVTVLAVLAAGSALRFQQTAREQATEAQTTGRIADGNRLAALSATAKTVDLSLLLAVAGMRTARTPSTEDALLDALLAHRRAVGSHALGGQVHQSVLSRDGRWLFVSHGAGAPHTDAWQVGSTDPPRRLNGLDPHGMAASADGGMLLSVGWTDEPYLLATTPVGRELHRIDGAEALGGYPRDVAVTDDGRVLTLVATPNASGSRFRGSLAEVDLAQGSLRTIARVGRSSGGGSGLDADLADDGTSAVVWSQPDHRRAFRLDVRDGRTAVLALERRSASSLGFFALPDGAAQAWSDGAVTLYDAAGRPTQLLDAPAGRVHDVRLLPDGRRGVTVGDGGQVRLWTVAQPSGTWRPEESLTGHDAAVAQAETTAGNGLLTVAQDGSLVAWDLSDDAGFGSAYPGLGDRWISNRLAVVQPGKLVVAPSRQVARSGTGYLGGPGEDTTSVAAVFLDPSSGREVDRVVVGETLAGTVFGSSVSVSPDGTKVAVTSGLDTTVLDARTREVVARIRLPKTEPPSGLPAEGVWCTAWSDDGDALLLCAEGVGNRRRDGGLVVVDASTWRVTGRVDLGLDPQVLQWNPDRTLLAVGHDLESKVTVLDRDLAPRHSVDLGAGAHPYDLAFSPNGDRLAATGDDGSLAVIDTAGWRLVHAPIQVHSAMGLDVEWLPGGETVVTAGKDEMVTMYDVAEDLVRGGRLPAGTEPGDGYTYLLPGIDDEIVVLRGHRTGHRYPLDPARWLAQACGVAGRDFTPEEWSRYLPVEAYRATCSDLTGS